MWHSEPRARERPSYALRLALLGGVSVLPMSAVFFTPHGAHAQTCPPSVSGNVTGPVSTVNAENCLVTGSGVISGGTYGITNANANKIGTLGNSGTISGNYTGILTQGGIGTLVNSGTISDPARAGINNYAPGTDSNYASIGTLSNSGTISGAGSGILNSTGVVGTYYGTIGLLTNSGTITAGGDGVAGIYNSTGGEIGTLVNQSSGTISSLVNATKGTIGYGASGAIGTGATAVSNAGAIGALTNYGTISAKSFGITNTITGTIGTLTNSGAIIATATSTNGGGFRLAGLSNQGSITSINNKQSGTISGYFYGLENQYDGTLGTLINSGVILGAADDAFGLTADNIIGVIDNTGTGTISGGEGGVSVDGDIGTIINAGTIAGHFGMYESGASTIGTFANSGLIAATFYPAIDVESGTINVFTNSGTISSSSETGVGNTGEIGTLTNSGVITGQYGLVNDLTLGTLLNETAGTLSGTISGSIGILSATYYNTPGTISLLVNGLPGASITKDTVFGTVTGIANQSVIGTLANNGTVSGGTYGIANSYHVPYVDDVHLYASSEVNTPATIVTLTNTGSITGGATGVYNDQGYIGTLSNTGTIAGTAIAGTNNTGTIGTLNSSGTILGGETGISNNAVIGTLSNSGLIASTGPEHEGRNGGPVLGLQNGGAGTIGVLSNAGGTISGGSSGVYNLGAIGTLANSGSISGGSTGVDNEGIITTLSNTGHISGGSSGVDNEGGTISTLTNSGTIIGTNNAGIYNSYNRGNAGQLGTIGELANQTGGLITGSAGIYNTNSINTLSNSGTIAGDGAGVYSSGTIGQVANASTGTISALQNFGGTMGTGATIAIDNAGTIGLLENAIPVDSTLTALIAGAATGIHNTGQILTLSNGNGIGSGGTISGADVAINNASSGTIGSIANYGTLTATTGAYPARLDAVNNDGLITALHNYSGGSIIGGNSGINNQPDGTIGTLTNEGVISGLNYYGIDDSGTIARLNNDLGTISGLVGGVGAGNIGALTNSGLITGSYYGIYSSATIGGLTNSGTIQSTRLYTGVDIEGGTVGLLANTGVIAGPDYGVDVAASTGDLVNAGSITGTAAGIENSGAVGAVLNVTDEAHNATISGTIGILNTGFGTIEQFINGFTVFSGGSETIAIATISAGGTPTIANLAGTLGGPDVITGVNTGISNQAMIGTLTNGGTIEGGFYGIINSYDTRREFSGYPIVSSALTGSQNQASITTLTNSASITGGATGIYNDYGYIGTLTNSGSIIGTTIAGVDNTGTIGTLANAIAGTIYGGKYGVLNTNTGPTVTGAGSGGAISLRAPDVLTNSGYVITNGTGSNAAPSATIGVLSNSGSIIGGATGVYNDAGYIGTLANSGEISGAPDGVDNFGSGSSIGTILNQAGGTISGYDIAIFNNGNGAIDSTIGAIINNGLLAGNELDIDNSGSIGTVTNSGMLFSPETSLFNIGSIGTISNSGTIDASFNNAILNDNAIGAVNNTDGGTVVGQNAGISNNGTILIVSNSGLIESGALGAGIFNFNSIGTLSQSGGGTIYGGIDGVSAGHGSTIAQLTNGLATPITADTIFGSITGVSNNGGYIGNLANNGTISGGDYGIANSLYQYSFQDAVEVSAFTGNETQGSIVTLTNNGSIYGGEIGIYNDDGYIGTLSNYTGATIAGGATAINNFGGTITSLTNSGTIAGTIIGINNSDPSSTIGTIINQSSGTIYGGAVALNAGDGTGINNAGLITSGNLLLQSALELGNADIVSNSGTISGGGLLYDGSDSTVTNSGTIAAPGEDAVDFYDDDTNYLTLTTGTDIVGTIYGNGSPGQITLDGTGNLTAPVAGFGTGSALNIDSNGDWTASGTWAIAAVTNDGSFGPGETAEGGVGSTLYLTGNFTQNADGILLVAVAPEEESFTTSDFVITGSASLSGAVSFTFAPGTYEAGSHSFLSATNVTGTFTSQHYTNTPNGLTASVTYPDETDPLLVLTGSGGTGIVNTGTTTTSTTTTTPTMTTTPVITTTAAPATTPAAPRIVVRPPDTGVFADELQSTANLAQASNAALLGKAAEGGAAASAVCAAEAGVTPAQTTPQTTTGVEKLTNAVADAFCGAGGWIQASGTAMDVEGDGDIPGYNADTAGFLAGIDTPVGDAGTRLGLAVGYDETFLADSAGGKGQVDTVRAGIFGSQPLGPFMLAGDFLYGHTSTNSQRVTGIGYGTSSEDGNIISGAVQADTLLHLGTINLIPQAGLRVAGVSTGSFAESGLLPAFALAGDSGFYTSVQPFVNLDVSSVFLTASNVVVTPDASFGYAYEAGDIGRAVGVTAHDGTHFSSDYLKLDPSIGELSAGISAGKDWWSLYARYSAAVTGNWTSQTGEAGLRIKF